MAGLQRRQDEPDTQVEQVRFGEFDGPWVAASDYERVKTHLYARIDTLKARAEAAEAMLIRLVDRHHVTLTGSKYHDPENQDWPECPCKTCAAVAELLPERAADALAKYRAERENGRPPSEGSDA